MVSGPVTSVARVEDVQIFLKDPVYISSEPRINCFPCRLNTQQQAGITGKKIYEL